MEIVSELKFVKQGDGSYLVLHFTSGETLCRLAREREVHGNFFSQPNLWVARSSAGSMLGFGEYASDLVDQIIHGQLQLPDDQGLPRLLI